MAAAAHFAPTYPLALFGYTFPGYSAFYTVILNLVLAVVLTPVFNAAGAQRRRRDETVVADYFA
jgi:SSS family solute:Na+ symporter